MKDKKMNSGTPVFAVVDQAVYNSFFLDLARHLKRVSGAQFHYYATNVSSLRQCRDKASDVFDTFNEIDRKRPSSTDPADPENVLARAARFEERIGRPMGWFKIVDRATGLGYSPAGYHHPRTRHAAGATDLSIVEGYVKILEFWEKEIYQKKIKIILNGFYFEYFSAISCNCKFIYPMSSRYKNKYYWARNCFGELPTLESIFNSTIMKKSEIISEFSPYGQKKMINIIANRNFFVTLKRAFKIIIRNSYDKYVVKSIKDYSLKSEIVYIFREWWVRRRFLNSKLVTLDDLHDKDYVFFALQVEPEVNLHGYSPEYFFQHQAIMSLSRDLPAGVILAVKEHLPALGRRPALFYKQIGLLKNVVFVDVRNSGLDLVRNACAVATINGTVGQEAAILGKPVISFGRHNLYNILPHVRVIRQEEDLYPSLLWALSENFSSAQAKIDGQRYLKALESECFDMKDFGFHNPHGYTQESIKQAAEKLLESLDIEMADEPLSQLTQQPQGAAGPQRI